MKRVWSLSLAAVGLVTVCESFNGVFLLAQGSSRASLTVASTPPGLRVYVANHDSAPPATIGGFLTRTDAVEQEARGQTPATIELAAGHYTIAVEQIWPADSPEAKPVPKGSVGGFSFSGSSVFFKSFKCSSYVNQKVVDAIDPYERDGNIGICFDAAEANKDVRYFRLYSIELTQAGATLKVALRRRK